MTEFITASEATQLWGLGESTLRSAIRRGQFEKDEYRKSGRIWLVSTKAMERMYGEMKAIKIDEDTLREWLEKLYYRAGTWQGKGGECHLYGYNVDGEIKELHFADFAGHNSWCEEENLICLAVCEWFDPLHYEDYADWWEHEEESKDYPNWEEYASKFPEDWEKKLDQWRQVWLDVNVNDWMQEEIDSLEEHLEQIGKVLILV